MPLQRAPACAGKEFRRPATSRHESAPGIPRNLQANHDPAAWKFVIAGEVRRLMS